MKIRKLDLANRKIIPLFPSLLFQDSSVNEFNEVKDGLIEYAYKQREEDNRPNSDPRNFPKKRSVLGQMPRNGVTGPPSNPGNRAHAFRITVVEHLTPSNYELYFLW